MKKSKKRRWQERFRANMKLHKRQELPLLLINPLSLCEIGGGNKGSFQFENPMKRNVVAAVFGILLTGLICVSDSFGQSTSGTFSNLLVSGSLTVSGTSGVDIQGNSILFGTITSGSMNGEPGVSALYTDGTASTFSLIAMRSSPTWLWERNVVASGVATVPMMQLDSRHVLTIFDVTGNPAITLDPNAGVSANGSNFLTQADADALYLPSNGSLSESNGNIGIQTNDPYAKLQISDATPPSIGTPWDVYTHNVSFGRIGIDSESNNSALELLEQGQRIWGFNSMSGVLYIFDNVNDTGHAEFLQNGDFSLGGRLDYNNSGNFSGSYISCISGNVGIGTPTPQELFTVAGGMQEWYQDQDGNWQPPYQANAFVVKRNGDTAVYGMLAVGKSVPKYDEFGSPLYDGNGNPISVCSNALVVTNGGDTTINGRLIITGTAVSVLLTSGSLATKIVSTGSNRVTLVPEQGDLSMGDFINGAQPVSADPSQGAQ